MKYKAILFDLDGTLADTLADLAAALNHALNRYGLPGYDPERVKTLVGTGWENLIGGALGGRAGDAALKKAVGEVFVAYYDAHFMDATVVYDGILRTLQDLSAMGIRMAVVTNKRLYMARLVMERLFGDLITAVYGPDDGIPVKPDPFMPNAAMKELGVRPEETLFAGDSGVDMITARNCGAAGVGVLWGFRGEPELRAAGAAYIIDKPQDLLDIVKG